MEICSHGIVISPCWRRSCSSRSLGSRCRSSAATTLNRRGSSASGRWPQSLHFEQAIVHTQGAVYRGLAQLPVLARRAPGKSGPQGANRAVTTGAGPPQSRCQQARRLQALLGFKEQSILQTMPAQVVGSSGSEQSRSLFLDKALKMASRRTWRSSLQREWLGRFCRRTLIPLRYC